MNTLDETLRRDRLARLQKIKPEPFTGFGRFGFWLAEFVAEKTHMRAEGLKAFVGQRAILNDPRWYMPTDADHAALVRERAEYQTAKALADQCEAIRLELMATVGA